MARYALDLPINAQGGPEHVRKLLGGEKLAPANYWLTLPDGSKIVYHVCGGGPKLVVSPSPGWGCGMNYIPSSFKPMMESGEVTFVVMQTRGSLPSERPKDESQMGSRHMADDIEVLRCHLGYDYVTIMGHSNAGAIGLSYAQKYSSHCTGLVLVDSQVIGLKDVGLYVKNELQRRKDDPRYADAVQHFMDNNVASFMMDPESSVSSDEQVTSLVGGFLALYFWDPPKSMPVFVDAFGELTVQHWPYIQQFKGDTQLDAVLIRDLNKITAQTLVISGTDDWICSVEGSRVVAEGIGSHAEHVVFDKCGHVPFIEDPDRFFGALMPFIAKLPVTKRQ